MNTAGAGSDLHRRPILVRDQPKEQIRAPAGRLGGDLAGEQEQQRWPPFGNGAALAEHRQQVVPGAQNPLGGEKLLNAQMIEGGPVVRPRQQQTGTGQEILALPHRLDPTALVRAVLCRELRQHLFDIEITYLRFRAQPRGLGVALVHAERDRFQPRPRRLTPRTSSRKRWNSTLSTMRL
jgi:hypothetical protein